LNGYRERSPKDSIVGIVLHDRPTCGIAWQEGADHLMKQEIDYLHFTADDIVPGIDWWRPMVEACDNGDVPVALVCVPTPEILDLEQMPRTEGFYPFNPLSSHACFFEGEPPADPRALDGTLATNENQYPSIPFCSRAQWKAMGQTMIASHYGTDRWFGVCAARAGFRAICTADAVFYHYVAQAGRFGDDAPGWTHTDRITFDLNITFPMYRDGSLPPHDRHPEWGTRAGRDHARDWYRQNVPQPWPWEDPNLPEEYR
jgi:hypothetical protein